MSKRNSFRLRYSKKQSLEEFSDEDSIDEPLVSVTIQYCQPQQSYSVNAVQKRRRNRIQKVQFFDPTVLVVFLVKQHERVIQVSNYDDDARDVLSSTWVMIDKSDFTLKQLNKLSSVLPLDINITEISRSTYALLDNNLSSHFPNANYMLSLRPFTVQNAGLDIYVEQTIQKGQVVPFFGQYRTEFTTRTHPIYVSNAWKLLNGMVIEEIKEHHGTHYSTDDHHLSIAKDNIISCDSYLFIY
ncbi:hypothetical protein GEMRC1_009962 [Eukaryota sp. GEM-RC1]